LTDDKLMKMI